MSVTAKNPAAVSLGRLGGLSKSPRKRLDAARAKRLAESGTRARKERRAAAAEVLAALIECERAIREWMDAPTVCAPHLYKAVSRATSAIERATGAKPGSEVYCNEREHDRTKTNQNEPKGTKRDQMNNIALYNCSLSLWASYRQTVMESGRQPCLALTPDGSVSNSREIIARFSSLDEAKSVLLGAGWVIDGDRVLVQKEWIKHAPVGGAS